MSAPSLPPLRISRFPHWTVWLLLLFWSLSAAVKVSLAYAIVFDYDVVPVVSLGWDWLHGGLFPLHGTLSSVAAYNMPGLVWLHLPALMITDSPFLAIVLTLLLVNMLGTFAVCALGQEVVSRRVGLGAAVIFTFSETSFSASTIDWAQLVLPSLYVWVALALFRWWRTGHGGWMVLAGGLAVFALMVHFSAVLLLPVCGLFWLVSGARLRGRWLLVLAGVSGLLLAPYLMFQTTRDFRDLRAFVARTLQIDRTVQQEVQTEVARLAYEQTAGLPPQSATRPDAALSSPPTAPFVPISRPLLARLTTYLVRLPREVAAVLHQQSYIGANVSPANPPPLAGLHEGLALFARISLLAVLAGALMGWLQSVKRTRRLARPQRSSRSGRVLLLALLPGAFVAGLLVLRVYPTEQPTYLAGLQGWTTVLVAVGWVWALERLLTPRLTNAVLLTGLIIIALAGSFTYTQRRILGRVNLFPQATYYGTLVAAADFIAQQAGDAATVTIRYELWPEQRGYWWVPAWSLVDDRYRLGMALDFVLRVEHGLVNTNTDAYGRADQPDFVVTYATDPQAYVAGTFQGLVVQVR